MLISFSLITFLMCIETNFNRTRLKICILTVSYAHCLKMFYYKGQPCIPSFSIWLVKTESDFIVRSFKTGLGRWTLVVAVISVWCLSFFSFLRPDLSPWGYGNRCFLVALYCLIVRRRNLEVATKRCKPDNFESHDSLILSFTNIWSLCSNFVECESFLESNSCDIFALCETNLDDSTDSGNFSVRSSIPLIRKDSTTDMHGSAVYVKEVLPFTWGVSPKNSSRDSYICFQLPLLPLSLFFIYSFFFILILFHVT